ncbi:MAG TPA: PIN domain-containing protein [Cellvibrio sp.]
MRSIQRQITAAAIGASYIRLPYSKEVPDYNSHSAAHYGDIRASLERKGTPIGVNDLHIAGHARSRGLILVTNNLREFGIHHLLTAQKNGVLSRPISKVLKALCFSTRQLVCHNLWSTQ